MSYVSPAWNNITDSSTTTPSTPSQDGYVLLLVLLSVFIGGTLLLLTGVLILCKRCCDSRLRQSRPSDDAEKTNTSYVDESQPPQEITIRVEDAESLSTTALRDMESERFLCTTSSGRRVSFNEGALSGQERKDREKGRRYTLTEGDFHYLKNARLTFQPLPSLPPTALQILTIHESEGGESSSSGGASETRPPSPSKSNISIYQPPRSSPAPVTRLSLSLSSALPGDMYNSVADTSFMETPVHSPPTLRQSPASANLDSNSRPQDCRGPNIGPSRGHGAVLHFFSRLRRHASLEGASPYLKIKKWKLGNVQRASSLDTRGSPKRHQFQRQRAASESAERDDVIQCIVHTQDTFPSSPGHFISQHGTPPHSLGRLDHGAEGSLSNVGSTEQAQLPPQCDIWSLRASLELCGSDQSSSNNDRDSVRSDADSVSSLSELPSLSSQDLPDSRPSRGSESDTGSRKLLQMDSGYASIEAPCRSAEEPCSSPRDKTASEKRLFFTYAGRKGTVFESLEGHLYEQSPSKGEEEAWQPQDLAPPPRESILQRDYSIDEKTDALFNEFLRHDPQYDDSPLRMKHRSRAHLRKQWQRTKQYSDPGVRYPPALDRHRAQPLRRGDSTSYLSDTRYHSTLPRIASSTDEEGVDGRLQSSASLTPEDKIQAIEEEPSEHGPCPEEPCPAPDPDQDYSYGPQTTELLEKIGVGLAERLYPSVQRTARSPERLCTVAHISPDHSPV
ncbi:voltage-dependent calcium channel beta subunit-associated regulatory protein isoform X1 [Xenopus laevis]|uniref:Voltage-dependent calcium channel beta subunit-associated regulatory protein isoform X1 n=2 Tax=Xenopus laevis TaxID=8355 RepID=A0A8J1M2A6_XENLA|nr:voltage-dependent calcium channel beta subunit-associated regulatory protein isoform X1 [Xenopus laevis]